MIRRSLLRLLLPAVCIYALLCSRVANAEASGSVFSEIRSIVQTLSEISGLEEKHPIPYGRINKRQLRQFLAKRIKKSLRPEEIKADELALKMWGFVPQDFDLRKSTMDLLTEQAAAFYDYDEKKLFLMAESNIEAERVTLAHELSHALADQHFNLEKFMDEKPSNDDENLAHSAVVEGQASWLMIAYGLKASGQSPVPTRAALQPITDSETASSADYPVLAGAPSYIRESLVFPYSQGTAFFHSVFEKLGKEAFAEVFRHPPSGSSQIIHPERYFSKQEPTRPPLPSLSDSKDSDQITEGSVSEFDHSMLVAPYLDKERRAKLASHLVGGRFEIDGHGKDHRPLLRYISEWDSPESAEAFFALYPKILLGKWQHCDLALRTRNMLAGTGDSGYFVTRLAGKTVWSIEGLSNAAEWQELKSRQ